MDDFEKKCKIDRNDVLGRYLVAAVDIKAGETLLLEKPLMILPSSKGEKRCGNCHIFADDLCTTCNVFTLCRKCKQHNADECKFFADMTNLKIPELQEHGDIHGPLRCLLMREKPELAERYAEFMQLEAHLDKRRGTDVWKERQEWAVEPLIKSGVLAYFRDSGEIDEELLQTYCGIIDVNAFEIRAPVMSFMRALYLRASLFSHDCVANTMTAIDKNNQIKIYANRDVAKGEPLTTCYTDVMLGTEDRQYFLQMGKYFHCSCQRCEDPTELGTHMSTLICPKCSARKLEGGYVLRTSNKEWKCQKCGHTLRDEGVENILDRIKDEIFHAQLDIAKNELLIAKFKRILHPNHYLMMDMKQNMAAELRAITMDLSELPERRVYERKVRLCQDLLMVLQIIQPGISRLKAITLHELSNALAELSRLRYELNELREKEVLDLLHQSEVMLRESVRMMLHEPVDTPEGELAKSMLKELKDLQADMRIIHSKIE